MTFDKTLLEDLDGKWTMDMRLTRATAAEFCVGWGLDVETDAALHMVLSAFLEGETRVLSDMAELTGSGGMGTNNSDLELWRLLKYSFDRPSAVNMISTLDTIRRVRAAKAIHDILPNIATLESPPGLHSAIPCIEGPRVHQHAAALDPSVPGGLQEGPSLAYLAGEIGQETQEKHEPQLRSGSARRDPRRCHYHCA